MSTPEIAVVVSTYRRPEVLRRLLDHLARQTLAADRWQLVVVDNCSQDAAVDAVLDDLPAGLASHTTVLRTTVNRGPAAARNLGWRSTDAEIVAFTDDDVVPDPEWLAAGLAAFADESVGVVEGPTRPPSGTVAADLPYRTVVHHFETPTAYFPGCNVFYRRAAIATTTGFDEHFGWWGEDTSLGWQVLEAGWNRGYASAAVVQHDVEVRPLAWWIRAGWREQAVVELASRHPGLRAEFWQPWSVRRRDAELVLAVVSFAAGFKWTPAWCGMLPYALTRRPSFAHAHFWRRFVDTVVIDGARVAGHLAGSLRHRTVIV